MTNSGISHGRHANYVALDHSPLLVAQGACSVQRSNHRSPPPQPDQTRAPLWESIRKRGLLAQHRHHTPGHKNGKAYDIDPLSRQFGEVFSEFCRHDTSVSDSNVDNLHHPSGPILEAQALYAAAVGSKRTYFLTNGSTQGNQILLGSAVKPGGTVIVPRGCHKSVSMLFQNLPLTPHYINTEYSPEYEAWAPASPESVAEALDAVPHADAVLLVSPTYPGHLPNIRRIAATCRARSVPLCVDGAWGALHSFTAFQPTTAIQEGATLITESTHKTLAAFEPTAVLHIGKDWEGMLDEERVDRWYRMTTTTSPSYPALASIDVARRQAALFGNTIFAELQELVELFKQQVRNVAGLRIVDCDDFGFSSVVDSDPFKVIIDVTATGLTGARFASILEEYFGSERVEMANTSSILLLFLPGDDRETVERLAEAISEAVRKSATFTRISIPMLSLPPVPKAVLTPFDALNNGKRRVQVSLRAAVGMVAAAPVYFYPPGWLCLEPGEQVSPEIAEHIEERNNLGCTPEGLECRGGELLLWVIDD